MTQPIPTVLAAVAVLAMLAALACSSNSTAAPGPEPTSTSTHTPTPTPEPTEAPTSAPAVTPPAPPASLHPTSTPLPRSTPLPTATPLPTEKPTIPIQPSQQSPLPESDYIFWLAANVPVILNSPAINQLRSDIEEFTVYELDFVATLEKLVSSSPVLVEVFEQYVEHKASREAEGSGSFAHTSHWVAYYGKIDEQTVLDDSRFSSEMPSETHGRYDLLTVMDGEYTFANRGPDTFARGTTETLKAALYKTPGAFFPALGECFQVHRNLGDHHLVIKAQTSPEGRELESEFNLKEPSPWDEIPPWIAVIQHALRSAPEAVLTLTLEGDTMDLQVRQHFDNEADAAAAREVNQETLAEVASPAVFPEIQEVINRLQVSQHGSEVSYNITLTGEEAEGVMFWGLLWYFDH